MIITFTDSVRDQEIIEMILELLEIVVYLEIQEERVTYKN
jgi:hypothetical protein